LATTVKSFEQEICSYWR